MAKLFMRPCFLIHPLEHEGKSCLEMHQTMFLNQFDQMKASPGQFHILLYQSKFRSLFPPELINLGRNYPPRIFHHWYCWVHNYMYTAWKHVCINSNTPGGTLVIIDIKLTQRSWKLHTHDQRSFCVCAQPERDDEMTLQCNIVSHWLGTSTKMIPDDINMGFSLNYSRWSLTLVSSSFVLLPWSADQNKKL